MSDIPINPIYRRDFLQGLGKASLGAVLAGGLSVPSAGARQRQAQKKWEPVSHRKVRVGIVGYGVCRFGAAFGFQDHPNVRIVAVSDLIPERREGLMKACRCDKSYESLEVLVNVYEALAMTVPGIVAHDSALKDGETLKIPQYVRPKG